jgi:hypothetical protein
LNIDVGDNQIVGREGESILDLSFLISSQDGSSDNLGRVSVELVERVKSNFSSYARGDSLAGITNEIRNGENLIRTLPFNLEMPVVREFQAQTSVISGLYNDNISHEIRTKLEAERFNDVRSLGLVTRQRKYCELLVGSKHNKVRSEDNSRLLGFVIVDLDGSVVRCLVGNYLGLSFRVDRFSFFSEKFLNNSWKIFGPSFFVALQ